MMPTYQFECEKCGKRFDVTRAIDARGKPSCPTCASRAVRQIFGAFYPKTIKKS
jgi:putative FmdB family regulatory protein